MTDQPAMRCQWAGMSGRRCENAPDVVIDTADRTGGIIDAVMVCTEHAANVDWILGGWWESFTKSANRSPRA